MIRSPEISVEEAKERFLEAFKRTGIVLLGCQAAGIGRATVYIWKRNDPEFAAAWEAAREDAADRLEAVAWQRATSGLSDRLLEFLLRGMRPQKYRDRASIELDQRFRGMSREELKAYVAEQLGLKVLPGRTVEGELAGDAAED